jgi:hypothetical protein
MAIAFPVDVSAVLIDDVKRLKEEFALFEPEMVTDGR